MLSEKAKYAIKAVLALADHPPDDLMRISDLARAEQIPPKFLELILGLKNQGILQSRKGKGDGTLTCEAWRRTIASASTAPGGFAS